MTVKELILKLATMNPEHRVVTDDYEGRYTDIKDIKVKTMVIDYDPGDPYQGPHEELSEAEDDHGYKEWDRSQIAEVVYIGRHGP